MMQHRLRREIISTHLTNNIVDHIGPGFGFRVREEAGTNIAGVTRAYLAASKIYQTDELWRQIEALDNKVSSKVQLKMMRMLATLLEQSVLWLLRTRHNEVVVREVVDYYQQAVAELVDQMPQPLAAKNRLALNKKIKYYVGEGVPRELAEKVAAVVPLTSALDVVDIATQKKREALLVSQLYFNLSSMLELYWIREQTAGLSVQSHWHSMAKSRLINTLDKHHRELAAQVLSSAKRQKNAKRMIGKWIEDNQFAYDRHIQMITDLKARASVDFAMLSVIVADVGALVKTES
jgi:glutamate dehydrogenase